MFLIYLDLAEVDQVFRGRRLWSTGRWSLARYARSDHLGDAQQPLDECIRDLVFERRGHRPLGPIRLLTQLRYFGYVFNPVSFYYCYELDGTLSTMVAEVNNTPWGERHSYVLDRADFALSGDRTPQDKSFHVSPFMPMDVQYRWQVTPPADSLHVHIDNFRQGDAFFDVTLHMQRRPITTASMSWMLMRHAFMPQRVTAGIYWQALRLWLKRVPFFPHPDTLKDRDGGTPAPTYEEAT